MVQESLEKALGAPKIESGIAPANHYLSQDALTQSDADGLEPFARGLNFIGDRTRILR